MSYMITVFILGWAVHLIPPRASERNWWMAVFTNMIFLTIYSADKLLQRLHFNLNPGLGERVVVLIEKNKGDI